MGLLASVAAIIAAVAIGAGAAIAVHDASSSGTPAWARAPRVIGHYRVVWIRWPVPAAAPMVCYAQSIPVGTRLGLLVCG